MLRTEQSSTSCLPAATRWPFPSGRLTERGEPGWVSCERGAAGHECLEENACGEQPHLDLSCQPKASIAV
ncbi:hypothetical protein MHYP_G00315830 [Metynnis hypsauchen]